MNNTGNSLGQCKYNYKGKEHRCNIIEKKLDKLKIEILDSKGAVLAFDWVENKQIKRIW